MIIAKTPLRVSFAGGGTDLPSFYQHHGYGAVFSSSIDKYLYVVLKNHSELYPEHIRLNYSETEQVQCIQEIRNPIIRECLKFLNIDDRLYISTVADAPGSSGLGSSSTFCVGLLNALYAFRNESVPRSQLAEEAAYIEIEVLGRPIGKQDHYSAAYGGLNYFKFNESGNTEIIPVPNSTVISKQLFSDLATFWTGVQRQSIDVLNEQNANATKNSETLRAMRAQALELFELSVTGNLNSYSLGALLNEGWRMKCSLASGITNQLISEAYDIAFQSGAWGGKVSGAGGGGFLNFVVPAEKRKTLLRAMAEIGLTYFPIGPEFQGATLSIIS
jgi:D-glycero-alpha-D-manno-heptose-7-phosphate kinase